ncbi:CPP1-like family protein [Cyanobacterium stanieri LEGE 03274]|uniref:CPP1-like family protein n=1 Tax=Cyanobacterium stanieri LEGE 03274 TaxID=1828756 RepID=A0ABR9V4P5_9CHRO|nr:CPP1-like family protein [Cyanobacterium stanieri]MBE9222865.1 CPP1-like family protein [Cyanobacterium stanieri LEGE 03274]
MSDLSPYETLGVEKSASFEQIQRAKETLLKENEGNSQIKENIEIAYDAIIMDRLKLRQEGKIKVPEQIRFPEKVVETKKSPISFNYSNNKNQSPNWLTDFIDQPSIQELSISGLIFLGLILLSVFSQDSQILPLLLTFGLGTSFFFVFRKTKSFWRSVGVSFFGFVIGISVSSLLATVIANSGLSLGFSDEQFVSLLTFSFLWLSANFTR